MSDVLLIHPAEQEKTFDSMPPLGMAWITSYLTSRGISTELADMQICRQSIESLLQTHKPAIVGIGGTSHTRFESFRIAREVKRIDPAIHVLYGGPHASFTVENTLRTVPEIDVVVQGEGEGTTCQVAHAILTGAPGYSSIPGISYRRNGLVVHQPKAERIQNLDALPFPFRDPEKYSGYSLRLDFINLPAASVISSRGCPVNCSFCSASALFGTQLTLRSAKNVVDEIEILLKEFKVQGIKFFDSTLTLKRNHVEALCAEIRRRELRFPWECEIRVQGMSYDLLRTMRDAGCYYVDFGVETASGAVLHSMHKGITLEQAENVFRWTKRLGMYTKVFFSFGHIGETIADARATVEFMEKNAKFMTIPATGIGVRIYPGTEVEHTAFTQKFIRNDFSWSHPYSDQRIESLGNDPLVPILIQPQFGWKEFYEIEMRLIRFWVKNPWKAVRILWIQIRSGRGHVLVRFIFRFFTMRVQAARDVWIRSFFSMSV